VTIKSLEGAADGESDAFVLTGGHQLRVCWRADGDVRVLEMSVGDLRVPAALTHGCEYGREKPGTYSLAVTFLGAGTWSVTLEEQLMRGTVPNVVGLSLEEARDILKARALEPLGEFGCDLDEPGGVILSQDPAPGSVVGEGSALTIALNWARSIPSVLGRPQAQAVAEIESAGFIVEVETHDDYDGRQDEVAYVSESRGCPGETVTVVVER
jgi:hypothetical protein